MTRRAPRQYPAASAVGDLGSARRGPFRDVCPGERWWHVPVSWLGSAIAIAIVLWPVCWAIVQLVGAM